MLVISSGHGVLAAIEVLLRPVFSNVVAVTGPGSVPTGLERRRPGIILLSVGFSDKVGSKGRKLC